jgi:hypothetical protein
VTSCVGLYYDQDGNYTNGCECLTDAPPDTCSTSATNLGTIAPNGTAIVANYNLAGYAASLPDTDWFRVTFQAASCNWSPHILLTTAEPTVYMRVYSSCTLGAFTCSTTEGGTSSKANVREWEVTFRSPGTCGDHNPQIDPVPDTGSFTTISTVYFQVYTTGSTTSCMPYTITVTN